MKRGLGNRGAVTVLVTLLLIPAILITGTGVDLARIYTSRAVLQDADQLALNSVLADYNALLQDLYGLFGVTMEDEKLQELVNKYVEKTIFAKDSSVTGNNLLRLFYGKDVKAELKSDEAQNLDDINQLRRQIEEYSKIRAPIVLANELLDRLDLFKKVTADAEIIDAKTDIEKELDKLDKYYKKIFDLLKKLDGGEEVGVSSEGAPGYKVEENAAVRKINDALSSVSSKLREMLRERDAYENALDDLANAETDEEKEAAEAEVEEHEDNYEELKEACQDLLSDLKKDAKDDADKLNKYIPNLTDLKDQCDKADKAKKGLKEKIQALRTKVNSSDCDDTLKASLVGPDGLLDKYEDLVEYDLGEMAQEMYNVDEPHISAFVIRLRNIGSEECLGSYTVDGLISAIDGMDIDITATNAHLVSSGASPRPDVLWDLGNGSADSPEEIKPYSEYKAWPEFSENNKKFLDILKELYSGEKSATKASATKSVERLFDTVKDLYAGLDPKPEGAWHCSKLVNGSEDEPSGESGWSKLLSDFASLGTLMDSVANKILLLTYTTEMFSCYTTKSGEKNMAGIPMSIDVNFMFQSELEYVYHGKSDAKSNHNAVGLLIVILRLVMDYIASFTIESVKTVVGSIKSALAGLGPIAIAVGELARLGMAAGEALVDLSLLRQGHKVAFLKTDDTWKLQLSSLLDASKDALKSTLEGLTGGQGDSGGAEGSESSGGSDDGLDDKNGLTYFDYLRVFLLFVDGDEMAERVKSLIQVNMTNKVNKIGSDKDRSREERESLMEKTELFELSSAKTGFVLTVSADMDMLFLSMPFAQKGLDGLIPPKTLAISAEGYRGY